jgi:HK97 family phage major capsid protein
MGATTELREELRARHAEVKSELDALTAGGIKTEAGGLKLDTKDARRFREGITEMKSIRGHLQTLGEFEEIGQWLDQPAGTPARAGGGLALGGQLPPGYGQKSIGQMFTESEEFKGRQPTTGLTHPFEIKGELSTVPSLMEQKDIYTAMGGTLTQFAFGTTQREPMVQRPMRTGRVRDLFTSQSTTSNLIEFIRVLGFLNGQNNAAMVGERTADNSAFALKPQTRLQFEPSQAPIRTMAHWEVAHRTALDDEPQLRGIIDNELLYGLRLVEDDQFLNGDGQGQNLLGILRQPGIQTYPGIAYRNGSTLNSDSPVQVGDTYVDAVRRAATRIMLAYYEPSGVVVHPFDWEKMETIKDANGSYLLTVNVAIGADKRMWQMPVVASPAIQQGTALIGAFGLGAKIYDRQQSNIRVAEQHADLFIRNAVLVLAEQRIGITVSRPEAFCQIDLEGGHDTNVFVRG